MPEIPRLMNQTATMAAHVTGNEKPAAWLVSALTTVALLLSAVGIGTGDVPQVLRDQPILAGIMFSLVIVGSLVGAWGAWHVKSGLRAHTQLVVSPAMLAAAAIVAMLTGIASAVEHPEPGITTAIVINHQGQKVFRFGVKDSGLKSSSKMTIKVTSVAFVTNEDTDKPEVLRTPLYVESLGPNSVGNIDQQGEVPVPPAPANDLEVQAGIGALEQCDSESTFSTSEAPEHPGCTHLHIARLFEKPQLTISWRNDRHSRAGLFVHVSAHDIGEHRVVLRIIDANSHHRILIASWPPTAGGIISKAITAIVPGATRRLCVAASTTQTTPTCSPPPGSGTAFVLTLAPPP
jgi:hypothetical protein